MYIIFLCKITIFYDEIPTKSGLTDTRIREFWRSTDMGGVGAGSIMGAVAENRTQWNNKIIRRRFRRNRRLGRSSSSQQATAARIDERVYNIVGFRYAIIVSSSFPVFI